jgi:hypothetical protein
MLEVAGLKADVGLTIVFCFLTTLLVLYPIYRYLTKQWAFRRDRLYGLLAGHTTAAVYYEQFRPGFKIGDKRVGDESLTNDDYMSAFRRDFDEWYGRRYYVAPVCGLAILSLMSSFWGVITVTKWMNGALQIESLHGLTASALAGAFVWVISDEIDRLRRRDFTSSDVYYYIFRILLAIPFSWALTRLQYTLQVGIPVAFFLGAFPTTTLFTAARRIAGQQLKLGESPSGILELEKLQSVGKDNAERFKDEGITTIVQLAYADPVDLTIRTNFDFNYVVDCVGQALLWIYICPSQELYQLSIRSAHEVAWLMRSLDDPAEQPIAQATLAAVAAKLNLSQEALRTTFVQIAEDPYTEFLVEVWE